MLFTLRWVFLPLAVVAPNVDTLVIIHLRQGLASGAPSMETMPILRWLRISVKSFHHGEKGFTLLEILIAILVLTILATVVVSNLSTFLTIGKVAAANTEVTNVQTAAKAFYAEHNKIWPSSSDELAADGYLSDNALVNYGFDSFGRVTSTDGTAWGSHTDVVWNVTEHKWEPASE